MVNDQSDVFNIIQKRPNTGVSLKVDEAMKVALGLGSEKQVGGEPSLTICPLKCSLGTTATTATTYGRKYNNGR